MMIGQIRLRDFKRTGKTRPPFYFLSQISSKRGYSLEAFGWFRYWQPRWESNGMQPEHVCQSCRRNDNQG
jgi:hypothetical protein